MAMHRHLIWLQEAQLIGAVTRSLPEFAIVDWLGQESFIGADNRKVLSSLLSAYKVSIKRVGLETQLHNFGNMMGQRVLVK